MAKLLIAGCGDVGTQLGLLLVKLGHEVWGVRRNSGRLPVEIRPLGLDLTRPEELRDLPSGLDWIFYTAAAGERSEAAYRSAYVDGLRNIVEAGQYSTLRGITMISSTSVYAQNDGDWVDENSPTEPQHFTGQIILEGENVLRSGPLPATIVRAAGIYGPGRTYLIRAVDEGRAIYDEEPPVYTNRIHRDDLATFLAHLYERKLGGETYIAVDSHPAPRTEVFAWIAKQLGRSPQTAEASARRSRGNKRLSNRKLLETDYSLLYPTYREGYADLIRAYLETS